MRANAGWFGIQRMNWAIRAYFGAMFIVVVILIASETMLLWNESERIAEVVTFAMHSFELTLGALLGALSVALEREFRDQSPDRESSEHTPDDSTGAEG